MPTCQTEMTIFTHMSMKLHSRKEKGNLRFLREPGQLTDFASNDYLGLAKNPLLRDRTITSWQHEPSPFYGSTGSRLLTGHRSMIEKMEAEIASYHFAESGLLCNSGYSANTGLISCLAESEDVFLYDAESHASTQDGLRLSKAQSIPWRHNDVDHLEVRLKAVQQKRFRFVLIESVYSCDGSFAKLKEICSLCNRYSARLIVDEAHATGIIGKKGEGLTACCSLQNEIFARIHTFSKAIGTYGAIILGDKLLKEYLINFCRPLIFATALPLPILVGIREAYQMLPDMDCERRHLHRLINHFKTQASEKQFPLLPSDTPIQAILVQDPFLLCRLAANLQECGIDARPLRSPTVKRGTERLRICLHAFNTLQEIDHLILSISKSIGGICLI